LEQLLPRLSDAKQQVTLYSSSNDKALLASKKVHGEARAGASGADLVVAPGLETIDASGINTDFLGHSYFAESRALITDMSLLINRGIRAGERPLLDTKKSIDARYWAFRP
jgi:esterase/lipase superfamily enzyme